jgi:hypothetical protein
VLDLSALDEPATAPPERLRLRVRGHVEEEPLREVAPVATRAPRGSCRTPWPSAAPTAYAMAPQIVVAEEKPRRRHVFLALLVVFGFVLGVTIATLVVRYFPHVTGLV